MCSAAHAWVGLGRIVYAASSVQLGAWLTAWGVPSSPVAGLPINTVAPHIETDGPASALTGEVEELHRRFHLGQGDLRRT